MSKIELHSELTEQTKATLPKPLGSINLYDPTATVDYCVSPFMWVGRELYGDKFTGLFDVSEVEAKRIVTLVMRVSGQYPLNDSTIKVEYDKNAEKIYITQVKEN